VEFIITNDEGRDIGALQEATIDFEIGDKGNSFEIEMTDEEATRYEIRMQQSYIYSPDTEFGGRFEKTQYATDTDIQTWCGIAWRGLLEMSAIEPPPNVSHMVVSGDVHDVFRTVLPAGNDAGSFFTVPDGQLGVGIATYQFDRFTTKLTGLSKMLEQVGHRLDISVVPRSQGRPFAVVVTAKPIQDLSQTIEFSQDYTNAVLDLTDDRMGVNHLICLGQGELTDRLVIHLYAWPGGIITSAGPFWTGIDMRTAIYEYSSIEDPAELKAKGVERLTELMSKRSGEVYVRDMQLYIGDIVGGRDRRSGFVIAKPITNMIARIKGGDATIEVNMEGA